MPGGYNNRGARGAANRSQRGSGQSSGRGASSSSIPSNDQNPFESERNENAAKRAQRGQAVAPVGGKGNWQTKQTGPQDAQKTSTFNRPQNNFNSTNPFAPLSAIPPSQSAPSNPFGAPSKSNAPTIFFQPNTSQPTGSTSFSGIFGAPSTAANLSSLQNPSGVFGAPSITSSNPFAPKPTGTPSSSTPPSFQAKQNPFEASPSNSFDKKPSASIPSNTLGVFDNSNQNRVAAFGSPTSAFSSNGVATTSSVGSRSKMGGAPFAKAFGQNGAWQPSTSLKPSRESIAVKIAEQLRKDNLVPPSLSLLSIGGLTNQKNNAHNLWTQFQDYRAKTRKSLMSANLLDDPEKPKKLKDAIPFKGTCEEMCPEFEVVTRIMDGRVDSREKDVLPDGSPSMHLNPARMVKALARSAAGQDAPLPSDVRSAAALRRTIDHLFNIILSENELEVVHGFLWDRTRAVRRDFVFHSSMSPSELVDQVYCLEHITRFHAIALHQMSREGIQADGFVEQQEREQLSKSLLSLMHAYEDCKAQGVHCENEIEFKSYYVLFNGEQPDILEVVQNWGWDYWGKSEEIKIAVSLAESIQNTWDVHGPLNPQSTTEIGQNAFARFFTIVEDTKVSYTMACFAEIYFTKVRKAILSTILSSYRKQRDQTKDWTLARLNTFLHFDSDEDVEPFVLLYGIVFEESGGVKYLSFDLSEFSEPHPPPKQSHSYHYVERKRGNYSLPETISRTVYDEAIAAEASDGEENELFVKDNSATGLPPTTAFISDIEGDTSKGQVGGMDVAFAQPTTSKDGSAMPLTTFEPAGPPNPVLSGLFSSSSTASTTGRTINASAPGLQSIFPTPPTVSFAPSFADPQNKAPVKNVSLSPTPQLSEPLKENASSPGTFSFLNSSGAPSAAITAQSRTESESIVAKSSETTVSSPFGQPSAARLPSITFSPPVSQTVPPLSFDRLAQQPTLSNSPAPISQSTSTPKELLQTAFSQPQGIVDDSSLGSSANSHKNRLASIPEPPGPSSRESRFEKLTDWVLNGEDGLLEHFTAFQVQNLVRQTFAGFVWEIQVKAEQEAERLARKEADDFRYRSLATKYGHLWRGQAQRLWLKRRAREARKARQEMAESRRASKAAESATIIKDFKASTTIRKRNSLESLLNATGVLAGVHDPGTEIQTIVNEDGPIPKKPRSGKSSSTQNSSISRHKRGKSDNPLRRSLISDPSYLSGRSRIHLLSKPAFQDDNHQPISGVRTDYFRLKARGITTLPNGTPLANTAAMDFLHSKRSFDGAQKPSTTSQPAAPSTPKANPPPVPRFWSIGSRVENEADIQALKLRAKQIMSEDEKNRQKRTYTDDDDELFERAKRLREQMDEGATWFRKEVEMDTLSRSVS